MGNFNLQESFFGGRNELDVLSIEEKEEFGFSETDEVDEVDNCYLNWDDAIDAELTGAGDEEGVAILEIIEEIFEDHHEDLRNPECEDYSIEKNLLRAKPREKFFGRSISFQNFSFDLINEKIPGKKKKLVRAISNEKARVGKGKTKMRQRDWRVAGSHAIEESRTARRNFWRELSRQKIA